MKITTKTILAIIIVLIMCSQSDAQLVNFSASSGNEYSQTNANKSVEAVVVGDFFGNLDITPDAALHVNTNYLNTLSFSPSYGSFGEVFQTDCPEDVATYWRMLRGNTIYGNIYNNADLHFYFEAPEGDIQIRAKGTGTSATSIERMKVSSGVGGNSTGVGEQRMMLLK